MKDLDLFIQADPENAEITYEALTNFGAALDGIGPEDFANPKHFLRFGKEPVAVDILTAIDGVKFEDAWPNRVEGLIDPETGLKAYFISKDDLVAAKIASGRLQDLADVDAIKRADDAKK